MKRKWREEGREKKNMNNLSIIHCYYFSCVIMPKPMQNRYFIDILNSVFLSSSINLARQSDFTYYLNRCAHTHCFFFLKSFHRIESLCDKCYLFYSTYLIFSQRSGKLVKCNCRYINSSRQIEIYSLFYCI